MAQSKPDFMSNAEYYNLFRSKIEYCNNLISQRIMWLSISQSFFFSAYTMLMTGSGHTKIQFYMEQQKLLQMILPIAGIVSCALSFIAIIVTVMDIPKQVEQFEHFYSKTETDTYLPPLHSSKITNIIEQIGPLFLPLVFFICWAIIIANIYFF